MIAFVNLPSEKSGKYKNAVFQNALNNEGDWWVASGWFAEQYFGFMFVFFHC